MHPKSARFLLVFAWISVFTMLLSACASRPVSSFSNGQPILDPEKFFTGHTHSWGIFEDRSGQPTQILKTITDGHLEADGLHFEQDLYFEKSQKTHRSWLVKRIDSHHYTATGTGIIGIAQGE